LEGGKLVHLLEQMIEASLEMDRETPQFRLSRLQRDLQAEYAIMRLKYPSRQQSRQMKPVRNCFELIRDRLHLLAS